MAVLALPAAAEDRADLEGTSVIGNRELPKVLYIVPWKKPLVGDMIGRPVESILDETLAPVDRDVFRRQVAYHGSLLKANEAGEVDQGRSVERTE